MIEAILDRKIDVAYALMQRIDTSVALSELLPQFKLLAGLDDDEATKFLADLLMFNMLEIPEVKPPFKKLAQIQAMEIHMRLCGAPNIGEMSVDGRVEVKRPNEVLEHDHVISLSVFQMEHLERPLDLTPSMSPRSNGQGC